jgi:hypothetical protein
LIVTCDGLLTLDQLAKLLKVLADHSYAYPQVTRVSALLDEASSNHGVALTQEQCDQAYDAIRKALAPRALRDGDVRTAVERCVATALRRDPRGLYGLLMQAWQLVLADSREEPVESSLVVERDGLLIPDPRDKDLDGLAIAELFFLVAHDRFDGRLLLGGRALACGVAAALLAELVLCGALSIDLASHQVQAMPAASGTAALPALARQALEEIQHGSPLTLSQGLAALSAKGHLAVRRQLVQRGTVVLAERGRFQKRTHILPVGETVDSIFRVATRPLAVGRLPTVPYALVIELAKATRLAVARHSEWIHVHHIDPGCTLIGAPGQAQLSLLLSCARAEVTEMLSRP